MESKYTDREKAEKQVELRRFYMHCVTFCIVNLMLFAINYFTSPGNWWFQWPLLGWGIGLLINGIGVWKRGR